MDQNKIYFLLIKNPVIVRIILTTALYRVYCIQINLPGLDGKLTRTVYLGGHVDDVALDVVLDHLFGEDLGHVQHLLHITAEQPNIHKVWIVLYEYVLCSDPFEKVNKYFKKL